MPEPALNLEIDYQDNMETFTRARKLIVHTTKLSLQEKLLLIYTVGVAMGQQAILNSHECRSDDDELF